MRPTRGYPADRVAAVRLFTARAPSWAVVWHMTAHHRTEASKILGVSTGSLRRLARGYEAAYGPLPTDGAGGRIYPDEVLDLMEQARELVQDRRVGTLEQAFKLLADDAGELAPQRQVTPDALMHELVTIRRMLEQVVADNAALREQLAAPKDAPLAPRRPWWKVWGNWG